MPNLPNASGLLIFLTLSGSLSLPAQSPAPVLRILGIGPIPGARVESSHQFSRLAGVRELSDGSVLVVDVLEQAILHVDFRTDRTVVVGRNGSGPGEYTDPYLIVPTHGDSSAVFDQAQWRWVFLASATMLTRTVSHATNTFNQMRGFDVRGRIYFEGTPAFGAPDSLPVLRLDPASGLIDTLALLRLPRPRPDGETGGVVVEGFPGPFGWYGPFAPRDDWAVQDDGTLVIVRVDPYRVDWLTPNGRRTLGQAIDHPPIRIAPADREAWTRRHKSVKLIVPDADGKQRLITPSTSIQWPEFKPPFEPGAVKVAPDRSVWVTRTRPANDLAQVIDIIGRYGTVTGNATISAGLRLLGLGRSGIYLIREDDDGLQTLIRQNVTWPASVR